MSLILITYAFKMEIKKRDIILLELSYNMKIQNIYTYIIFKIKIKISQKLRFVI